MSSSLLRYAAALFILAIFTSCRASSGGAPGEDKPLRRIARAHTALGTEFRVTVYSADATVAQVALRAATERLDALDAILNTGRVDSEVSSLNAAAPGAAVRVSDELFLVLAEAQRLSADTDGAFDVTTGPYVELWRRAAAAGTVPTPAELANAKLLVGWRNVRLDAIEHTATLTLPGMRIDLSGIAHGYAADEAMRELRRYGCERSSVAAGDVRVFGAAPPRATGWRMALGETAPKGQDVVELHNAAAAFSPNAGRGTSGQSSQSNHRPLIQPGTGRALVDRPSVVVFSHRGGAVAQGFAVAAAVIGQADSPVLARAARGNRYRFGPAPRGRGR